MSSIQEQIQEVEDEIRKTQYNKATSHHIGRLKAKIARLRDDVEKKASAKSGGDGYSVRKSGDGTVTLVGFPSVLSLIHISEPTRRTPISYAVCCLKKKDA